MPSIIRLAPPFCDIMQGVTDILSAVNTYKPFVRELAETNPVKSIIVDISSLFGCDLSEVRELVLIGRMIIRWVNCARRVAPVHGERVQFSRAMLKRSKRFRLAVMPPFTEAEPAEQSSSQHDPVRRLHNLTGQLQKHLLSKCCLPPRGL
eukprot:scaffold21936_cov35-Tisochrysis_lutea.AAC.3